MLERLPPSRRNLALAAIAGLVLWFAWSIRAVVNPLLLGYLAAYILHPLVLRLENEGMSRRKAVNLIFAVGALTVLSVSLAVAVQGQMLLREMRDSAVEAPSDGVPPERLPLLERVDLRIEETRAWLQEKLGEDWIPPQEDVPRTSELLRKAGDVARERSGETAVFSMQAIGTAWGALVAILANFFGFVTLVFLIPLYTYFLLFELGRIHAFVRRYLPVRDRDKLVRIGGQIGEVLSTFFRGRLLVCLLKGAILWVGLWIAQVPFAFLLGMASGFLSLVPLFGPLVGFVVALIFGVGDHGVVGSLVRCGVVFGLAELIEGYVLLPKILGDSLGLHEIVVLFALMAGGAALGLFGVLIALPLTATIVILVRELVLPALAKFADEET